MLLHDKLKSFNIVLASQSPRRRELLRAAGIDYRLAAKFECEELYPATLAAEEVAPYLSLLKSRAYPLPLEHNELLITADTVVVLDGKVLGKPHNRDEAFSMLSALSDSTHTVFTGVCIIKNGSPQVFCERADVTFFPLTDVQIEKYIDSGSPFDKAGGYGIQDDAGIGFIKSLSGELSCVIGLPMGRVIDELEDRQ